MGNIDAAARTKKLLSDLYPDSKAAKTLNGKKEDNTQIIAATKDYEAVYDLFLEGRFAEAKEAKRIADSTYGTTTWQPQLLYIEAVYHSKLREDSAATSILTTLVNQNPNTPIAAKANNLINALSRRAQIEDELNRLQIERPAEDSVVVVVEKPMPVRTDTIASKPKQDVVNNKPAPVKQDTIARKPIPQQPAQNTSLYSYKPDAAHYAVVVLNKVDKVFGNEARNAFTRYSREKFPGKPFNVQLIDLDAETKLVLIGEFTNLQTAFDYVQQAKPIAASQIVPWLKADKFSFSLISAPNLDVLKANPDLKAYSKFLEQNLPVKF